MRSAARSTAMAISSARTGQVSPDMPRHPGGMQINATKTAATT